MNVGHDRSWPTGDSLLMRTYTIVILGAVAIKAEDLKTLLGEPVITQPGIETTSTACFLAMFSPIIIHVVDGQHIGLSLSTAHAFPPISSHCLSTKFSIPDFHIVASTGLLTEITRLLVETFEPVMIRAEQLEIFLWKAIFTEPHIETMATSNGTAMICSIIVDVIYREES